MPPPIQFDAVLDRRDPASVVTALALDESGERAFVGAREEGEEGEAFSLSVFATKTTIHPPPSLLLQVPPTAC